MNIYIDGSCRPSTKKGAYGILIEYDDGTTETLTGIKEGVTNNIMELTAIIEALKHIASNKLDSQYKIQIFCDSQYVIRGMGEWWPNWKANGFKTSTGKEVKNLELWKTLMALCKLVRCTLTWVRGHADNERHNEIDKIVYELTKN